jgi:ATP-dependent DNA helicase RecG
MIKATLNYLKTNLIKERIIKPKNKAESDKFFNYPYQAFEEAVVNALYHRDYQEHEPVEIRIEPHGVAILSYAGPDRSISMEAIQKAKLLKARRYRNRRLGDFLKELDLSEGRATGIPTIQDELKKNGSKPACIETDENRSYFLIEIPCRSDFQGNIEPTEQKSELKSKLKSRLKSELKGELKTLRIILDLISEDPEATTAILVTRSGKSRSTVQKCIKILKEENCIDREGGKKIGHWIVLT